LHFVARGFRDLLEGEVEVISDEGGAEEDDEEDYDREELAG